MYLRAGPTRKVLRRTLRLCNPQNTHAPPRRDRGCQNTCLYIPLAYVCRSVLSPEHWRMALSKLRKIMLARTRRIVQAWVVLSYYTDLTAHAMMGEAWAVLSYYTDQLLTPCSKYFSVGNTLNGTPGGDRWTRVPCGQIGWLSKPLHRVDADCSGCTNLKIQTHGKNTGKNLPHPIHTISTTARRPRPPRDGARKHTSHVLARTRPLP